MRKQRQREVELIQGFTHGSAEHARRYESRVCLVCGAVAWYIRQGEGRCQTHRDVATQQEVRNAGAAKRQETRARKIQAWAIAKRESR